MDIIQEAIEKKNREMQQGLRDQAQDLIDGILSHQERIVQAQAAIVEFQGRLKALTYTPATFASVMGATPAS